MLAGVAGSAAQAAIGIARSARSWRKQLVVGTGWQGASEKPVAAYWRGDENPALGSDRTSEQQAQLADLSDGAVSLLDDVANGAIQPGLRDDNFDFSVLLPVIEHVIGGRLAPAVLGRDLHKSLGSSDHFTDWLDDQVDRCGLAPGNDYQEVFRKKLKNPQGGRPRKEFVFTLHAAKQVAMVAPAKRGRAVRLYFIEQERRLLAGEGPLPGSAPIASQVDSLPALDQAACSPSHHELAEFLAWAGLPSPLAKAEARKIGPALARRLLLDGRPADAVRDPFSGRWMFSRPGLEAWWREAGPGLLRSAA